METKKKKYILATVIGIIAIIMIFVLRIVCSPKVSMGKEIVELLQPILESKNQSMQIDVETDIFEGGLHVTSDIYLVEEKERPYFILKQGEHSFYITDNILFLENGNAYKISEETQTGTIGYQKLFALIASAYEEFEITKTEYDTETWYEVTVTGEQVNKLLKILVPTSKDVSDKIQNLQVKLVTKQENLHSLEIFGKTSGTTKTVKVTVSDFRELESNEIVLPELIKQKAETVDKDALFSLTEDLYRLIMAMANFAKSETMNGTVLLKADCEVLQVNKKMDLAELQDGMSNVQTSQDISVLLEMVEVLCMEGEIACKEDNGSYVYELLLDEDSMKKMTAKIIPEVVNYAVTFTEGSMEIVIEEERVSSIDIDIDGIVNLFIMELPIGIGAEFSF